MFNLIANISVQFLVLNYNRCYTQDIMLGYNKYLSDFCYEFTVNHEYHDIICTIMLHG